MSFDECLKKHTKKQIAAWLIYLKERWNNPTVTEFYLMQIAAEIRRTNAKHPKKIKLDQLRIRFQDAKKKVSRPLTPQERKARTEASKALWLGLFKNKVRIQQQN